MAALDPRSSLLLGTLAMALAHCGGGGSSPGSDGGTILTPLDRPGGDVALLDPCARTEQCEAAPGSVCETTFVAGLCTRHCGGDGDCFSNSSSGNRAGRCIEGICLPGCEVGFRQCSAVAGVCIPFAQGQRGGYCLPSCAGATASCAAGLVCNEYSGTCSDAAPTGGENGDPCRGKSDCRGLCIADDDTYGFLGGYCYSQARAPTDAEFEQPGPLPRSNCPAGSVAAYFVGVSDQSEQTSCYRQCTADADCRAGYSCSHSFDEGAPVMHTTGACLPINCAAGAACPAGSTCRLGDAGAFGHCVRTR